MIRTCIVAIVALALISAATAAGPSDFFSKKDTTDAINSIKASQNAKTGAFGSGILDTHAAVNALVSLDTEVPKSDLVCSFAQKGPLKLFPRSTKISAPLFGDHFFFVAVTKPKSRFFGLLLPEEFSHV
jgi:hypothetical protein